MTIRTIETDYLVIGAGAAGMAFVDSLISASAADVVIVDRRHAPGGHWNEAYPFVRLHQPAAYYGVNSMPLGTETIDRHGQNKGMYERVGAAAICAYYTDLMQRRLLPSGKVRYFPMCDVSRERRIVSRVSGAEFEVKVRKKVVDARYLEGAFPASSAPPFEVASEAQCVPVNAIVSVAERPAGYVIIGAGKTSLDACTWLLDCGVPPADIRWVKPREAWFMNRAFTQGGELLGKMMEGYSRQIEAAAQATSVEDLFARLEEGGRLVRVDQKVTPTMFRGPTVSIDELEQLRRIDDVVRLGRVKRILRDAVVLDQGTIPTSPRHLHVHCAARGLSSAPAQPIFGNDRITLQSIRTGLIPFNAAIIGFIEATRDNVAEKNRLCPPNPQPVTPLDWMRSMLIGLKADHLWSQEADIAVWLDQARVNPSHGVRARRNEPGLGEALVRFAANVRPGMANLERLLGE
jgi:hypothetical protein